jgi:hypothetical protein
VNGVWPARRRRTLAAAVLLLAAVGVHLGVAVPARRARDEAREAFARAREEREKTRSQVSRLERRASATVRAPSGAAAASRALRLSLLQATRGLALDAVRIGAEAGERRGAAARGRLAAEGRQADLLRAVGRLADPSSGVVLDRMTLAAAREGAVRLEVEAYSVRATAEGPGAPGQALP